MTTRPPTGATLPAGPVDELLRLIVELLDGDRAPHGQGGSAVHRWLADRAVEVRATLIGARAAWLGACLDECGLAFALRSLREDLARLTTDPTTAGAAGRGQEGPPA